MAAMIAKPLFTVFCAILCLQQLGGIRPQVAAEPDKPVAACPASCGNVSVPYPFSVGGDGCPGLPPYQLECRPGNSTNSPVLVLPGSSSRDFQVLSISGDSLIVNATDVRATCCNCTVINSLTLADGAPYALSGENKFFVNGCNSRGLFSSDKSNGYLLKCETGCNNPDPVSDSYCNSFGCCSSPVPAGSREIVFSGGGSAHSPNSSENSCGFSSVIYPPSYSTQDADALGAGQYGLKLQWAIQESNTTSCEDALQSPDYACAAAASCRYSAAVPGYNCFCDRAGYSGDGYARGTGCFDLNKCETGNSSCAPNAICTNTDGGHQCACKDLYQGDGLASGSGCTYVGAHQATKNGVVSTNSTAVRTGNSTNACGQSGKGDGCGDSDHDDKRSTKFVVLVIAIITSIILLAVLLAKFSQYVYKVCIVNRYRAQDFFTANMSKLKSLSGEPARLFTYKELSKAANGFSPDREIGTGGYGTVFRGTLQPEGTEIAIKKTNHMTESGAEQFLNEVTILSQVNHRNLVKLLGCCLETEVPMLVYEYIPNGTLYDHLQAKETKPLKCAQRLQIAIETAEALTYLHSAAFPPIYHRDVKSTNILLDTDLTVRVTDFGLSRLVPNDVTHVSTVAMGTPGYMDPSYYQSYQFTDKSDVYSFGVVLMELITSLKPVDFSRSSQKVNLAALALLSIKTGKFTDIVDPLFTKFPPEEHVLAAIHDVAMLAVACLAPQREQRPGMKEVMEKLTHIKDAYDMSTTLEEGSESIDHREYADPAGIIGLGATGAYGWDSGSMDAFLNTDMVDLEGR